MANSGMGHCGITIDDPITWVLDSPTVVITLTYYGDPMTYSGYRLEYKSTLLPSTGSSVVNNACFLRFALHIVWRSKTNKCSNQLFLQRFIMSPDYVMAVAYRGKQKNKWLRSWLTSPRILLSGPQCLELNVYIQSPFSIMIGSYNNVLLQENRVIWKSRTGLGAAWHHLSVDVDLPPKEMRYNVVFESRHWAANYSYTAAVDNVTIHDGYCSIPGGNSSVSVCSSICLSYLLISPLHVWLVTLALAL